MAIFTPSESPAVVVKEIDLTGVVPNVQSTTGAFVGNFGWGPVEERVLIDNEANLAATFGNPLKSSPVDFLSAAYFLKYSSSLFVVREVTSAARNANSSGVTTITVKNRPDFDTQQATLQAASRVFVAKYPGTLGNNIRIHMCPTSTADVAFDAWAYASYFDNAPGTSTFAASIGATSDEIHVIVRDAVSNTILETYPFLSLAPNAKTPEGSSNYILDVINSKSNYVWIVGFGTGAGFPVNSGTTAASGVDYFDINNDTVVSFTLSGAVDSATLGTAEVGTGFDFFNDKDTVQVDFLIAPGMTTRANQTTVVNNLVAIATARKDCVVITSPCREDIINSSTPVPNSVTTADTFTASSYLFMDNNYLRVYDKYNDQYIFIPAASSTAGIMASSDFNNAPWYSPAGSRRGGYLGVTSLAYSPTKAQRDTLYRAGVNPIANIPGSGILLYGDKTKLGRPSAFDRINVRRLFLVVERAIAVAARDILFEFNDEFTRAEFVNIVEPFLREIKGRRGITDFRVVCDETNNTAAVIDRNEFVASVFIKPARSINYVTLNFVAVRTGVDFDEVVGLV